ncbi:MAG: thioredoxin family protein [Phycisphaerales bacterium]|nr:MAG: thioredoxin family protein [Phycisphaerales bacterium]
MKRIVVSTVCALAAFGFANVAIYAQETTKPEKPKADEVKLEIGKPAPDFTLKDLDGKEHKLADLKGKIVVLEWTNHSCPVVQYHQNKARTMQATYDRFKSKGVVWLAIDSSYFCAEQRGEIGAWKKDNKIEYPILLDADGKVGRAYGAKTTPHMYVLDKNGHLAYAGAIDSDPKMSGSDETKNYVADAVDALMKGSTIATTWTDSYGCSVKFKK